MVPAMNKNSSGARALEGIRICDLTGQLAGAGATRYLAAMGAQVIRIEDPVRKGRWDILRGASPFVDERRGVDLGGAFNNHNVEKLGITLNMRTDKGRDLFRRLVAISDAVTENFAADVLAKMGFTYDDLRAIRPDIVYVSNCGFGFTGPYREYKTWGPIVQAVCGLTFTSGLPDLPAAGWGYSYMDHHGGNFMAIAILAALVHRNRTGEGQWIDMASTEAGASLNGPAILDFTVNGRPTRRPGMPNSNRNETPRMAPHGVFPASGEANSDNWVAIACRNDDDWRAMAGVISAPWADDSRYKTLDGRLADQDILDAQVGEWTSTRDRFEVAQDLRRVGVPAAAVQSPQDRIDNDAETAAWGLWPQVKHTAMGDVRVDGVPVHFSETDWVIERGAPCLGEHNEVVFGEILGLSSKEMNELKEEGVL